MDGRESGLDTLPIYLQAINSITELEVERSSRRLNLERLLCVAASCRNSRRKKLVEFRILNRSFLRCYLCP